jgi:hypothetical protein
VLAHDTAVTIGDLHFSIKLRLLSPEVQSRACRRKAFD